MSDDLAAFFAKKASKSKDRKKKGVINIEAVGQQLERKAKILETGDYGDEEQVHKSSSENPSKNNQNAEDSEWIDFSEKPSLVGVQVAFKEFNEQTDNDLEEEKRRLKETKTWNVVETQKEAPIEILNTEPKKYVAKGRKAAATLDININSEEMFPSIANADEVEKIQKAQAEERRLEEEERKKRMDEENKRREEERKTRVPPRQHDHAERASHPYQQRSGSPAGPRNESSAADDADTWRRDSPVKKPAPVSVPRAPAASDDSTGWRSNAPASGQKVPIAEPRTIAPINETGAWRSSLKSSAQKTTSDEGEWRTAGPKKTTTAPSLPKETSKETATTTSSAQSAPKYVPPWQRNKQ